MSTKNFKSKMKKIINNLLQGILKGDLEAVKKI
jgi:hypothetical protein